MKILIINGPNMQKLASRGVPYNASYQDILDCATKSACTLGVTVDFFASDIEGELVQAIGNSTHDAIIINAAAYSHTSIAIRDALSAYKGKKIEVHMSNVYAREEFRHHSMIAPVCDGTISGFGIDSYKLGLIAIAKKSL